MLNLSHSRPLNQFQQEAAELLHQFETDKTPIVITINGKAVAVLQDAESYEKLLNRLELLETLAGIRQSLGEFDRGEGVSIHQV
ncbi:type II toxin-antitoxin system Phd/YefM family antitoxin [Microcoleus sp. N9_B2]|uniref:type II toxin-antitoxin system Phd/YefM family antitoxin n=1 Tax=unclassified Microcoleus TaxID=2642155 RepID=UPI002FD4F62B